MFKILLFSLLCWSTDATFFSVQSLIQSGKTQEALFLLEKVPDLVKQKDPMVEPMFEAEVALKQNKIDIAEKQIELAKTFLNKNKNGFFTTNDLNELEHSIALRKDKLKYEKLEVFTAAEAIRAAKTHHYPKIEYRNGVYRVHFENKDYRIDHVRDFYKLLRAQVARHVFKNDLFTLYIEYGRARTDHVLYDEADELKNPVKPRADEETFKSIAIRPLSFVGNLFSYKTEVYEEASQGQDPVGQVNWTTLDLRTGQAAEILDFIDLESFARTLRSDSKLQKIKDWPPMQTKNVFVSDEATLDAFKKNILKKDTVDLAFESYDPKTDILKVQILVPQKLFSPESSVLVLDLKPNFVFRKLLKKQTPLSGFFINHAGFE